MLRSSSSSIFLPSGGVSCYLFAERVYNIHAYSIKGGAGVRHFVHAFEGQDGMSTNSVNLPSQVHAVHPAQHPEIQVEVLYQRVWILGTSLGIP